MDTIEEKTKWEEQLMNKMMLSDLIQSLSKEEQELIRLRYFDNKTQREIGIMMGISQVQVSRMERKILLSLKTKMEAEKSG